MCSKHVHSTVTRASRFHCLIGVINKPVYPRLAVAKFLPRDAMHTRY